MTNREALIEANIGIAAQRFYEASGLNLPHTAKPEVVAGLRAALAVFEQAQKATCLVCGRTDGSHKMGCHPQNRKDAEKAHTPTGAEREALIEEAAYERYPDIEANPETFPTGWSRESERNAFIAGVMFEQAHTPTDDEPVAYGIYGRVTGNLKYVQVMDEQEVAEQSEFYDVVPLFRRPVQGEPTAAREFLKAALAESDADEAEGGAGWDVEVDARTVLGLLDELSEPQGEPEWEYGVESRFKDGGEVWDVIEWGSLKQAQEVARDRNGHEADIDDDIRLEHQVVKRVPSVPAGPWLPIPDATKEAIRPALVDNRDPECVKAWPGCHTFGYDPACCRFPKSCSAGTVATVTNHESEGKA